MRVHAGGEHHHLQVHGRVREWLDVGCNPMRRLLHLERGARHVQFLGWGDELQWITGACRPSHSLTYSLTPPLTHTPPLAHPPAHPLAHPRPPAHTLAYLFTRLLKHPLAPWLPDFLLKVRAHCSPASICWHGDRSNLCILQLQRLN